MREWLRNFWHSYVWCRHRKPLYSKPLYDVMWGISYRRVVCFDCLRDWEEPWPTR